MKYKDRYGKFLNIIYVIIQSCIIAVLCSFVTITTSADDNKLSVIYFFSSTCSDCYEAKDALKRIELEYDFVNIQKFDITDLDNKSLLNVYCKEYDVSDDMIGMVPIIFVRNTFLYGSEEISEKLENIINMDENIDTIIVDNSSKNFQNEILMYRSLNIIKIFLAALLNGLNPCSFSILLFLIMLLGSNTNKLLKIGFGFCVGKILAYILMGSICFKFLKLISSIYIINTINILFLLIFLTLSFLNFYDYYAVKSEKYGNVKAQLPIRLRKFNHNLLRQFVYTFENSKWFIIGSIIIGGIVASSEFLCSGQIYLSTIVTIIQTNVASSLGALLYLIIYSIVCMIPLGCVIIVMHKGKNAFAVSEFFRIHLPKIKIIYAVLFFIMSVYIALQIIRR